MIERYENNIVSDNGSYVKYEDYKLLEDKNKIFHTALKTIVLSKMTPEFIKEILKDCTIKIRNLSDKKIEINKIVNNDKLNNILNIAPSIVEDLSIKVGSLVKSKKQKNDVVYKIIRLFVDLNTDRAEIKTVMVDKKEVDGSIHPNVPLDLLVIYKPKKDTKNG